MAKHTRSLPVQCCVVSLKEDIQIAVQNPAQPWQTPTASLPTTLDLRWSVHWACEAEYSTERVETQLSPKILPEGKTLSRCRIESKWNESGLGRVGASNSNWAPAKGRQIPFRVCAPHSPMLWFLHRVPKITDLLPHRHVEAHWGWPSWFLWYAEENSLFPNLRCPS